MKLTWLQQAIVSLFLLTPAWLGIVFASRVWNVRGDVALLFYMIGVVLGTAFLVGRHGFHVPPRAGIIFLFGLGLLIGALANYFLFRSVTEAPNAGIPVAISNAAAALVFVAGALLARYFPKYFPAQSIDPVVGAGIILTILGVTLISWRR